MFRAIWEFAQSADCVAQTEDPQIACQYNTIHHKIYNYYIINTYNNKYY